MLPMEHCRIRPFEKIRKAWLSCCIEMQICNFRQYYLSCNGVPGMSNMHDLKGIIYSLMLVAVGKGFQR